MSAADLSRSVLSQCMTPPPTLLLKQNPAFSPGLGPRNCPRKDHHPPSPGLAAPSTAVLTQQPTRPSQRAHLVPSPLRRTLPLAPGQAQESSQLLLTGPATSALDQLPQRAPRATLRYTLGGCSKKHPQNA